VKETTMSVPFHSIVLATVVAATVAVGVASAALYVGADSQVSGKADRLPLFAGFASAYVTFETSEDGGSLLNKVPLSR
jgi:hypothetical protein